MKPAKPSLLSGITGNRRSLAALVAAAGLLLLTTAVGRASTPASLWTSIPPGATKGAVMGLDLGRLEALLDRAPRESSTRRRPAGGAPGRCRWPDGGFRRFRIEESPIMEPELAAQFPEIQHLPRPGPRRPDRDRALRRDAGRLPRDGAARRAARSTSTRAEGDTRHYVVYDQRDYRRSG